MESILYSGYGYSTKAAMLLFDRVDASDKRIRADVAGKGELDAGRHKGARFAVGRSLQRAADEITGPSGGSGRVTI